MQAGQWHAAISAEDFLRDQSRLFVGQFLGQRVRYLLEDGSWADLDAAEATPPNAGIVLPRGALEAVRVAIEEWQGLRSHGATETKVLREWLAAERARVDQLIGRALGGQ